MEHGFLIDINALVHFLSKTLSQNGQEFIATAIDKGFNISIINRIEILGFKDCKTSTIDFINQANVFELNREVAEKTIDLRKKHKIKLPDAIIAATSLAHEFTLVTGNTTDFQNIGRLKIINPNTL